MKAYILFCPKCGGSKFIRELKGVIHRESILSLFYSTDSCFDLDMDGDVGEYDASKAEVFIMCEDCSFIFPGHDFMEEDDFMKMVIDEGWAKEVNI